MTKSEKLRNRFLADRIPTDFTWDELKSVMSGYGFKWKNPSGGSHGFFENEDRNCVIKPAARPHPGNIVRVYQIREYRRKLKELNII